MTNWKRQDSVFAIEQACFQGTSFCLSSVVPRGFSFILSFPSVIQIEVSEKSSVSTLKFLF